jgi:hypothetical protein
MKKFLVSTVLGFASISFLSAATTTDFDTNQVSGGTDVMITNSAGQVFSAAKLADNLKSLRSSIEQTMPMVEAMVASHTNAGSATTSAQSTKDKSLTGKLEDFASGVIKKDNTQSTAQNKSATSKAMDALRGLLKTNANNTATASSSDQSTLQTLTKLNNQLKNVLPTLDQLNVTASSSGIVTNGSLLTPTGR